MSDPAPYNEAKLLREISEGDENAFRMVLDRYWNTMYGNILYHCKQPELASELTQDIFVAIWQNRTRLTAIERFDAYLYTIARRLVIAALRGKVLPLLDAEPFDPYFADDGLTAADLLELKELQSVIQHAIEALPPQMQRAFTLHRFQGLSHEKIAAEMNISKFSSQTYVARALIQLRTVLSQHKGEIGLIASIILNL